MAGERFIQNNLNTYIGGLSLYLIPSLIFKNENLDVTRFSSYVKHLNNSVVNLESLEDFNNRINEYIEFEDEKNNFIINYLFYRKSKSEFKVLRLIKDVPPSRLDKIRNVESEIISLIKERYNDQQSFKIDIRNIYYSIPIGKNDVMYSKYLDLLDAVFSNRKISYSFLIDQFTEVARIIRFQKGNFNISPKGILEYKIIQLNFLLSFLNRLNLLRGNIMAENADKAIDVPDEIASFWEDIGIYQDDCKKAAFLLGNLIGKIGNEQYRQGHESKPVLNKLNFQGISTNNLIRLSNGVFEKLMQYKILKFNERAFSVFKELIDGNINNWKLSNQENVFYILSGYSFATYQAMSKQRSTKPDTEQSDKKVTENE
jgi:CRISPR-associated protein Csh1